MTPRERKNQKNISQHVYRYVRCIPKGNVTTYGIIGKKFHISPRYVGFILHRNPDPSAIPCYRVVNARGFVSASYAFGGPWVQQKKLKKDGVQVIRGIVDLTIYLWKE